MATMNDTSIRDLSGRSERIPAAVSARGLLKHFGKVKAADGIDLDVPRGMIFAILCPNGAGKTTLALTAALAPTTLWLYSRRE